MLVDRLRGRISLTEVVEIYIREVGLHKFYAKRYF
jgi:hypothetical protein